MVIGALWLTKYFLWWYCIFRMAQNWGSKKRRKWSWLFKSASVIAIASALALFVHSKWDDPSWNDPSSVLEFFNDNGYNEGSHGTAYLLSYFWFFSGTLIFGLTNPRSLNPTARYENLPNFDHWCAEKGFHSEQYDAVTEYIKKFGIVARSRIDESEEVTRLRTQLSVLRSSKYNDSRCAYLEKAIEELESTSK